MRVGRYDYPAQFGARVDNLLLDIRSMLLAGDYILCDELRRFEGEFADFVGVRYARGVNSGTDALTLALRSLKLRTGDEVITQANTFYATVAAIVFAGAKPVLVDADDRTFLINTAQIQEAVSPRTRVLVPVHLYGKPTPMANLMKVSRDREILIVEDAAQAHGAGIEGRHVGSFGNAGCFSFHPSKNLAAAGDGGAIVTDSEEIALQIDAERNLGQWRQNEHLLLGSNSRLDAIQARVLRWKLGELRRWNESRQEIAALYRRHLSDLPVQFQEHNPNEVHAYHLFAVRCLRRDALLAHLRRCAVDAVVRYPVPIHLQPAFAHFGWRRGQFPVAERLANELLCLPIRPHMPPAEVEYVSECIHAFFKCSAG